eukprot:gene13875-4826_t
MSDGEDRSFGSKSRAEKVCEKLKNCSKKHFKKKKKYNVICDLTKKHSDIRRGRNRKEREAYATRKQRGYNTNADRPYESDWFETEDDNGPSAAQNFRSESNQEVIPDKGCKYLPLRHFSCVSCEDTYSSDEDYFTHNDGFPVTVITHKGRLDVIVQPVECKFCGFVQTYLDIQTVMRNGYWPGSTININCMYAVELLDFWNLQQSHQSKCSETGFLQVLSQLSRDNARSATINSSSFQRASREWKFCKYELDLLAGKDWMQCPPCSVSQLTSHIDGNSKLRRYQQSGRRHRPTYYGERFVFSNENVDYHVGDLYRRTGCKKMKTDNQCGNSVWEAAANKAKRKMLDETGLLFSSCRHQVAQKALNMFQGELFAYHHFWHLNDVLKREAKFFFQDIACRYKTWVEKIDPVNAAKVTFAVNLMHGAGHDWTCQLFEGGRFKEGIGRSHGEDCEIVNSFLSSASCITQRMKSEGKKAAITDCRNFSRPEKVCLHLAELVVCDSLPSTIHLPNEHEFRRIYLYYEASLLSKRKKPDLRQIEKTKQKVVDAQNEFGLPDSLAKLNRLWNSNGISTAIKINLLKSLVTSIALYGCESWTYNKCLEKRIYAFELRCFRRVLGITWKQKITNVEVEQRIRQLIGNYEPLLVTTRRRKLQWFGHITRQNGTLAHDIMHGAVESSRGRGRPRNTWLSDIANWTGKSVVSCMRVARDRGRWRKTVNSSKCPNGQRATGVT